MTHFPRKGRQSQQQREPLQPRSPPDRNTFAFRPRAYIVILVLVYGALSLTSWCILCTLSWRPLGKSNYEFGPLVETELESIKHQVSKWSQASRVVSGVVGVLTLPLTSSVCAFAAVNFTQPRTWGGKSSLTLNQTVTLANKGWTSPLVLFTLPFKFKSIGSFYLYYAIALHNIGGILSPLQQLVLDQEEIHTLINYPVQKMGLLEPPRLVIQNFPREEVALLRAILNSARPTDLDLNLWQDQDSNSAASPFVSMAPSNIDTKGIRQFAPRLNSSMRQETLQKDDFPSDCSGNSFFRNYTLPAGSLYTYQHISVCMPGDLSISPFRRTRDKYDFDEVLYLKVKTDAYNGDWITRKLILSTTVGYFELPNSLNGNKPGPLQPKDPIKSCPNPPCEPQIQGLVLICLSSYFHLQSSHL
ncbi:hypothetical protein P170DRAFT_396957 [Aspergillus steynii IBT 23096]|uniref:Uncharacterized protein n=1 Tax=Aspergillus steynii IBT 23096 TaxID=1392250 RepID=A0A2I2GM54_9EURO|nr:uncharacterized protein P170DRAFT_396957 [Aspergillus steynii IBT 23096]PLB53956.1 hypothetical protein P170DRAFT_396957 [Aspergillus steynii IBT 23096]